MTFDDLEEIISVQELVGHPQQVLDNVVETFATVTEEIQPKLQAHARVALVIGKLDIVNNLSQNIKCLILLCLSLRFYDVLQDLLETSGSFRYFPVPNLEHGQTT